MLSDTDVEDHYNPAIRLIDVERNGSSCGFKLTRGKWDPYPWVSSVDPGTAADSAGLKPGDCLLEVNGEDVIGQRISEVAEIVKSKPDQVSLLLWNAGVDPQCTPEAVCCGPMPTNLQRLSACMSTILAFLECPVCLDTIPPPTYQCENGHLICIRCRTKSERCPVCRLKFTRGRSLLADQVYNALVDAFNLREEPADARTVKMQQIFKTKNKNKNVPEIKVTPSHTHKFLARIVGKSTSVENLANQNLLINEFDLRSKSLSTHEIFEAESPVVSRTNSISRLSRNEKNKTHLFPNLRLRPASCHGSFESLQRKIDESSKEEAIDFYCPFASNCSSLIKGRTITEHFQLMHEGPLIQYFKPNVKINFSKILEYKDLCYLIHFAENIFFIKIELDDTQTSNSENLLIWTWMMDTKVASKEYDIQVKVTSEDDNVIINVRSGVCSLNCVSYQNVREFKKGVLFNTKTFNSSNFSTNNIIFDINVLKSDSF